MNAHPALFEGEGRGRGGEGEEEEEGSQISRHYIFKSTIDTHIQNQT